MRKSLGLGLIVAAVIATALTPTAGWAAVNGMAAPMLAGSNTPSGGDPNTTITFTVTSGLLTMTAPGSADLGSGLPGTTISSNLGGDVVVTDDRALLAASWTATASSTNFTTGTGTAAETIPATDVGYDPGTITPTGTSAADTGTVITLSGAAQTVVTGTAVGDNTATWDPTLSVAVPGTAVTGGYTGTLTQSVS